MSGYGSIMQAPPFWRKVMHITGVLATVSLFVAPAIFLKYSIFDRPTELSVAKANESKYSLLPMDFRFIELYRDRAVHGQTAEQRMIAISQLHDLILQPNAQIIHPVECFYAKVTLNTISQDDPDPNVKSAASQAMYEVAAKGAVIKR